MFSSWMVKEDVLHPEMRNSSRRSILQAAFWEISRNCTETSKTTHKEMVSRLSMEERRAFPFKSPRYFRMKGRLVIQSVHSMVKKIKFPGTGTLPLLLSSAFFFPSGGRISEFLIKGNLTALFGLHHCML